MEVNKSKKLKKRLIIFVCFLIITGLLTFLIIKLVSGPASGTVLQPIEPTPTNSLKNITGKYLSLAYPARYEPAQTQNASASLESWTLLAHQEIGQAQGAKISLVVTNLPTGGAKEDSAYMLFSSRPEQYSLSLSNLKNDQGYTAIRKVDSYQKTILWPHGKLLLTASLTSQSQSDLIDSELNTIIDSVVWVSN